MGEAKRFYVSGVVQGVFFRANTQKQANKLGLTGWVRNLPDGRVEVIAQGEPAKVNELEAWLWQGPEKARVDSIAIESLDPSQAESTPGFEVR
jgi:acylphosphatase